MKIKALIIVILTFMSGLSYAGQNPESVLLRIQGEWHEQGQVCPTVLQFDYPDIVYIKTGQTEAHGKFQVNDNPVISHEFDYRFEIKISGNNGIRACENAVLYEVGDFPPMRFRLEENDTLNIEGTVFKREK